MSRIGRSPITVPAGVEVKVADGNHVTVKGPRGTLEQTLSPQLTIERDGEIITVTRPDDSKENRSLHGLTRSLLNNMVVGVSEGYSKQLDIHGVGYRAVKEGTRLVMNLGYSHQIIVEEIDGISIDVPTQTQIVISGIDKQLVGQFAADVRKRRPPEPYKGKGIRYANEIVRRKEGKTGAK